MESAVTANEKTVADGRQAVRETAANVRRAFATGAAPKCLLCDAAAVALINGVKALCESHRQEYREAGHRKMLEETADVNKQT